MLVQVTAVSICCILEEDAFCNASVGFAKIDPRGSTHLMGNCSNLEHIGLVVRMSILDTEVDGSNPSISMSSP